MKLYSKIIGKGNPILILHGLFGMLDNWKAIGVRLSESFEVHLIDQRNHGRSGHSEEFNYHLMANDLRHYINEAKLKQVTLLGHSMGGKVVMRLAVESPSLVSNLIIADIAPKFYPVHHDLIIKGLKSLDFSIIKSRSQADKHLSEYINDKGVRQFLLKSLFWKNKEQLDLRFNLESISNNIINVGEHLSQDDIFTGKTLFLKGANSNYILKEDTSLICHHFPNSKIIDILNSGHWLHAENPDDFLKQVLDWLS